MDTCFDTAIQHLSLADYSTSTANQESDQQVTADRDFLQFHQDDDGSEFSFACAEAASSPISADDLFHNGQIRPILPLFGTGIVQRAASLRTPSEQAFLERRDPQTETAPAPTTCRKSNSTGFSKLWRFRDLLIRSQSDGKETFVFLTENDEETTTSCTSSLKKKKKIEKSSSSTSTSRNAKKESAAAETKTTSSSKLKGKTTSYSAYAMQYGKNGEKSKEKRRSYLPYRQDLVGFFTNANAVTRNIHPY